MCYKLKEIYNKNKIIKVIIIIITIPILTYIVSLIFKFGLTTGTFFRKMVELVSC